jgi:hypothetical protein
MEDKLNERFLTVSYCRDNYCDEDVPFLRLKGKWLRDGGFDAGTHVKVIVVRDKLVITKDGDRARRDKERKLEKLQSTVYTLQQELTQQGELF